MLIEFEDGRHGAYWWYDPMHGFVDCFSSRQARDKKVASDFDYRAITEAEAVRRMCAAAHIDGNGMGLDEIYEAYTDTDEYAQSFAEVR